MLSVLSNLQNTFSMNDIGGEEEVWHFWPKIQNFQIFCTFLHRLYFFPLRRAYDLFCLFAGSKVICYTHRCILLPNSNHRGKIDTDSLLNFQHFLLLSSTSSPGITFSKPVEGRPWPLGRNQITPSLPLYLPPCLLVITVHIIIIMVMSWCFIMMRIRDI